MQPLDEIPLPAVQHYRAWGRLTLWVSLNRPLAWLVGLTAGLVLFLAWLPSYVRMFFWHGLQAQPVLASMTLGFSLLALSLLWSAGQRVDAWAFLFFNFRGGHPPWLDRLMGGFTQIGNGIFIAVLAVILFLHRGSSAGVRAHLGRVDAVVGGRIGESLRCAGDDLSSG